MFIEINTSNSFVYKHWTSQKANNIRIALFGNQFTKAQIPSELKRWNYVYVIIIRDLNRKEINIIFFGIRGTS